MNSIEPLAWFRSTYSDTEGGQCLEVALGTGIVHVRDSKAPAGPVLKVSRSAWAGFVRRTPAERYT
ncbi:DUF397 domain-containing protein [Streptomyces sp. NPDC046860]|uniref:DUF397 domain-containing protein n=1 Tax=Streptomyces sp. NPDC046860 TaxID=3154495 RepID=UPI00340AABEE